MARVFKTKLPVNFRILSNMHSKVPQNFKPMLWNESIVSLWRKRHFSKRSQPLGRFPPDRMLIVVVLVSSRRPSLQRLVPFQGNGKTL
jgi:hypothetical protein